MAEEYQNPAAVCRKTEIDPLLQRGRSPAGAERADEQRRGQRNPAPAPTTATDSAAMASIFTTLQPDEGPWARKTSTITGSDGHPNLSAERLKARNMRLEDMEGRKNGLAKPARNMDAVDKDPSDDLSKRISHHHWLRQQNTPLYT